MPRKDTPLHPWFMKGRYLPLIIVLVFVVLSAVTFTIGYRHYTINTDQTLDDDRSTANLVSLVLDEHLKRIISVMKSYIIRPVLLQAVKDKNVEKARERMIRLAKSNPGIESVIITDKQGTYWANYPERPDVLGKNFAYRDWYKGVSKDWKPYISDVFPRAVGEKDLAVTASVPFFDETGEVIGILVNVQRTIGLSNLIKQVPIDPGQFITVTDRVGQIVYSSRHDFSKEILLFPFYPGIKKAMGANNNTVAVDDPDLGGRKHYISFATSANNGWIVFVGRDKRSIILSGSAYYIQVTAAAFFLFLSITLFLLYSRKQVMAQQLLEQLQAEKKIRISNERYKSYIDVTMQLAWMTNDQGEIVEDNPSWSKYTGRGYEDIKGFGWMQDVHPDDRDHTEKIWTKAVAEKSFYETEYRLRRYDGVHRDYLARGIPLLDEKGCVREWVGTSIDITERKRAEVNLKESKELTEAVVENVPLMIFLKEAVDLRFVIFNRAGEELLGYDRKILLGKNDLNLFPPEQAAHFMATDREVLDGESGILDIPEEPILTAKKGTRLLHTKKVCIRGSDGATKFLLGISEDITERKQAEKNLLETLERLRRAVNTTIQVMVSAVEVRDPYTSGHQTRSADLARAIATEMGLSKEKTEGIRMAGSIHDIGKLSIPAEILSRPTKLSEIEFSLIKEHARKGYEMLKDVESPWPLAEIVHQHHERMDGSGYPQELKGEEILMEARILAVADVVEAMASHRPYRPGLGIEAALDEIEKNRGTIYDKTVADACLRLFRQKGFKLQV